MKTKIRIDNQYLHEDANINEVLKKFSQSYDRTGILVLEKNPKLHYHAYIESDITLPTLRKKLNEILTSTGNEAKSVSNQHHDWDVYKGYLFKHEDTSIVHIGTDYDKETLIKKYKNHANREVSGEQPNSIVVQLEAYLKDKEWTTIKQLARLVLQYHKDKKKLLDKHYIGKLITTLYVNSGQGEDRFIEDMIYQETPFSHIMEKEEGRVKLCKFCETEEYDNAQQERSDAWSATAPKCAAKPT